MDKLAIDQLTQARDLIRKAIHGLVRPASSIPDIYYPIMALIDVISAVRDFLDTVPVLTEFDPTEYYDSQGSNPGESIERAENALHDARNDLINVFSELSKAEGEINRLRLIEDLPQWERDLLRLAPKTTEENPMDLDNTTNCPLGAQCQLCHSVDNLGVATFTTPLGVLCCTVCADCVNSDIRISVALPVIVAMTYVAEHCEHLGIGIDDMASALAEEEGKS
ncbi:hypothetical protein [Amycolatopsis suaedae]|uniref:Uncharacterized protein n=1 Tax=Amycolatopsis suaedae TaxID=2510978 RepID=A0A4Q7J402_9PSEU|nr:hypothetical protein [Amycolatopsis suaedae]RZQ62250.1 hypothetical protein EWH70_18380 [Amycolatopsis suaedae]